MVVTICRKTSNPISPPVKFGGGTKLLRHDAPQYKATTLDSLHTSEAGQSELPSLPPLKVHHLHEFLQTKKYITFGENDISSLDLRMFSFFLP